MQITIRIINIITLIIFFALIPGGVTYAQKSQTSAHKIKFLTSAEVVFEFEQILNQATEECDKTWLMTYIASAAFADGDPEKAKTSAQTLLTQAEKMQNNCPVIGRAIHYGNLVLGHISLASGNIAQAKIRLIEAGKIPGDPAMNSFTPNMALARELLERNERAVVLEYLNLCSKFWKDESGALRVWKAMLKREGYPDFGNKGDNIMDYRIDPELLEDIQIWLKKGILTKPLRKKGKDLEIRSNER